MARSVRLVAILFTVSVAGMASAVPKILIVQTLVAVSKDGNDPNVLIADPLAQEFDQGGKLSPIVWGMTDPIFRAAAMDGKLGKLADTADSPSIEQAQSAARILNAEYVLACDARLEGGQVKGQAKLYRGGRVVWKDDENQKVTSNGNQFDRFGTGQSIARTIAIKLQTEAIKALPVAPKVETAEPTPGQAAVVVPTPEPPKPDDGRWRTDVETLISTGRRAAAVLALRDLVDAQPMEPERRKYLVRTLMATDPLAAADEAHRAAILAPEDPDLWILSARSYMQAGKTAEARSDLNEAVARHPNSLPTLLLLTEVSLRTGDGIQGLEYAERAIKTSATPESHFDRALCRAFLGGADGVRADLQAMEKANPDRSAAEVNRRYRFAIELLDARYERLAADVRSLIQRASVRPKDPEVANTLEHCVTLAEARDVMIAGLEVPAEAKASHARRVLAHKMLRQVLSEIESFIGGNADAIGDARIDLGEAIKQMNAAREAWSPQGNGAPAGA